MSSSTAPHLVLITGANGAVGYAVVVHALRTGYHVRAAIRTQAKADLVLNGPSIAALDASTRARLSFTIVPELFSPTAYEEALKDVTYVIHIASPIPRGTDSSQLEEEVIKPAIKGTMNMLEAAERSTSVERIVITSSVVAMMSFPEFNPMTGDNPKIYTEKSRVLDEAAAGPYESEGQAYVCSKILALNAAERWKKEGNRRISIVHVHPAYVLGKVELARTEADQLAGSSGDVLARVLGKPSFPASPSNTVHLEDVAEVHVRALDNRIPDGQSLVASLDGTQTWASGRSVLEEKFPKAIEKGLLPGWKDGWGRTKHILFDTSETKRLLGITFQSYDKQVEDIVGHYLDTIGEARA